MSQGVWISFPGCWGWPHWCYWLGVVASLVWGVLWRVALAEGAAASASFCVTGCTEGCGGGSIYGWGCLPWGFPTGEAGACGICEGGFGFLGFFGSVCFCCLLVYGFLFFPL